MRYLSYAFWFLVILLAVAFAVVNSHTIVIHYYLGVVNVYVPLLLLIVLIIGALLGVIAMLTPYLKMKHTNRKLRQQLKTLEREEVTH